MSTYKDVLVSNDIVKGVATNHTQAIETKIAVSSETNDKGEHECIGCSIMFKCVGVLPGKPVWCCQCEQACTTTGLVFWCSYACERESNDTGDTDDDNATFGYS